MPEMEYVDSTNIEAIGYDVDAQVLHVRFTSGREYVYSDVPDWVFEGFRNADSKGSYLNREIRNQYNYQEL